MIWNRRTASRPRPVFARRWALTVLAKSLDRLRAEHHAAGPGPLARFEALREDLTADGRRVPHPELATGST